MKKQKINSFTFGDITIEGKFLKHIAHWSDTENSCIIKDNLSTIFNSVNISPDNLKVTKKGKLKSKDYKIKFIPRSLLDRRFMPLVKITLENSQYIYSKCDYLEMDLEYYMIQDSNQKTYFSYSFPTYLSKNNFKIVLIKNNYKLVVNGTTNREISKEENDSFMNDILKLQPNNLFSVKKAYNLIEKHFGEIPVKMKFSNIEDSNNPKLFWKVNIRNKRVLSCTMIKYDYTGYILSAQKLSKKNSYTFKNVHEYFKITTTSFDMSANTCNYEELIKRQIEKMIYFKKIVNNLLN